MGEQDHVMATFGQSFDEQMDDPLDAAVEARRNRQTRVGRHGNRESGCHSPTMRSLRMSMVATLL